MTCQVFRDWIQSTFTVNICRETARCWLHFLGFSQKHHHMEVYFNGHEHEDVVLYRRQFVTKFQDLQRRMYPTHVPVLKEGELQYTMMSRPFMPTQINLIIGAMVN